MPMPQASSPRTLQVCKPGRPVIAAAGCDLDVPPFQNMTTASDTTAGISPCAGLGQAAAGGLFSQEAIFGVCPLNCCCEQCVLARSACVSNGTCRCVHPGRD